MNFYDWFFDVINHSIGEFIILFLIILFSFRGSPRLLYLEYLLANHKTLPDKILNFPVCHTSIEDYQNSWNKVENFIANTLNKKSVELRLKEVDINNIHLKGYPIDKSNLMLETRHLSLPYFFPKYQAKTCFYFEVNSKRILQKEITYPSPNFDAIRTSTIEYSFETVNGYPYIRRQYLEANGRCLKKLAIGTYDFLLPLSKNYNILEPSLLTSSLLFHIFGLTVSPKDILSEYKNKDTYKKICQVIYKITNIEIQGKELVIQSGNHSNE